jgi:hypothetical protein
MYISAGTSSVDGLMGQAARCHRISIPILLIAVTIQGIIPDARDLASLRALNLVCQVIFSVEFGCDDCSSSDEVCALPLSEKTREKRESAECRATSYFELPGPTASMIGPHVYRYWFLGKAIVRIDDLIHSHSCLNC